MLECDEGCIFVDGDRFLFPEYGDDKLFDLNRVRCDLLDLQAVDVRMGTRFRACELAFAGQFDTVVVELAEEGLLLIDVILAGIDDVAVFDGGVIFIVVELFISRF